MESTCWETQKPKTNLSLVSEAIMIVNNDVKPLLRSQTLEKLSDDVYEA